MQSYVYRTSSKVFNPDMNYKFVTKVKSKFNPCVIESVNRFSNELFICGTYRLVSQQDINEDTDDCEHFKDKLKRVNNRFGSLVIIRANNKSMNVVEEYECNDGGVFDIRVGEDVDEWPVLGGMTAQDTRDNTLLVMACHSNGVLAVYQIVVSSDSEVWITSLRGLQLFGSFQVTITTLRRYPTQSSLLTTWTPILFNRYSIVADSEGNLTSIELSSELTNNSTDDCLHCNHVSVTQYCQPIWSLFCHKLNDNRLLLFVGSDDSLLRIYSITEEDLNDDLFPQLKPIRIVRDFTAGVTSFGSDYSSDKELRLMVGSYDEWIRFYTIDLSSKNSFTVSLKDSLHIPESGIWRIITGKGSDDRILVSGMYSGAHLIKDNKVIHTLDGFDSQSNEKHLIYGLNCDSNMNCILMSSFYTNNIYLFSNDCDC